MKHHRILCLALALCMLCGLSACGKKGETPPSASSAASETSDASSGAESGTAAVSITIPFVVVPELTVRFVDMVQVINVQEESSLNVREGPGTSYPALGSAKPGERFQYLGESEGWRKIIFGGEEAYVSPEFSEVISVPAS